MKSTFQPILPGSVIGVLGSGQLGRMFAIAARRMGYRVHTFSPETDTPTGQVADVEIKAHYDDLIAVRGFASDVDVVTFEFENVPAATAQAASECAPIRPSGSVLHITQNRLREKTFLSNHGFPITPFKAVNSLEDLKAGLNEFGCPSVLKTAGFGYDGKGQTKITSADQADAALASAGLQEMILEAWVDFACELSVIGARGIDGSFTHWGVIRNDHRKHILDVSIAPADIPPGIAREAISIARAALEQLDVVGVLCVEFFLTADGKLLINELAPRPHNSGHLTFDACVTSQFEQQLRAVCALPLGSTEMLRPAAMANLLGDLWPSVHGEAGEPDWTAALAFPKVKLHLYGKLKPKPGRKMGHLTAMADSADEAAGLVRKAREALGGGAFDRHSSQ
ncbi:MAG TPA: 5-(carboxyamino)imidazole ribonucleotide synthase [Blastocatellia bacterium]|nr:5-(carboxyamino)imidazole ribonucleotide synthase [Blastocatellia bacterium]